MFLFCDHGVVFQLFQTSTDQHPTTTTSIGDLNLVSNADIKITEPKLAGFLSIPNSHWSVLSYWRVHFRSKIRKFCTGWQPCSCTLSVLCWANFFLHIWQVCFLIRRCTSLTCRYMWQFWEKTRPQWGHGNPCKRAKKHLSSSGSSPP